MRLVISGQEFMNDYSFINKIDVKCAASQLASPILEIVRRTDDGGNAMRHEVASQQNEFVGSRQIFPIENRNVRHIGAAPFAISAEQRFKQRFDWRELT